MNSKQGNPGKADERRDRVTEEEKRPKDQQTQEEELEEGLEDTFPASDPPSVSQPTRIGNKKH